MCIIIIIIVVMIVPLLIIIRIMRRGQAASASDRQTANLRTNIMDFRGFYSGIMLILRG